MIKRWLPLILIFLCTGLQRSAIAQEGDRSVEGKLEAAFLYQFTKFIEWPSTALGGDFKVVVLGDRELATLVTATMEGKSVGTAVIQTTYRESLAGLAKAPQILVLPQGSHPKILEDLKKLNPEGCLVVSFGAGMGVAGAHVNFYLQDDHLKFEINKAAADLSHLIFSAQILRLGQIVETKK